MILKKPIFFIAALFFAQTIMAQGGATIHASVDKDRILIGQPIQLTIEVYLSPESVKKFITLDSIEHFEFLEKPVLDTTDTAGGLNIRATVKITSFDSGHWVIPSFVLFPSVQSDTIPVDVVFSDFDPDKDYHDIKDILPVKPAKENDWWWMVAAGGLLLVLLIFVWLKKKSPPRPKPEVTISAYEEAKQQLLQLEKDRPEVKEYYSRLTDIFRLYVFRKKNILSLQKTTDDLVVQLKTLELGKDPFDRLSQSLRLSDFVKFAKYIPAERDKNMACESIQNAIDEIERIS